MKYLSFVLILICFSCTEYDEILNQAYFHNKQFRLDYCTIEKQNDDSYFVRLSEKDQDYEIGAMDQESFSEDNMLEFLFKTKNGNGIRPEYNDLNEENLIILRVVENEEKKVFTFTGKIEIIQLTEEYLEFKVEARQNIDGSKKVVRPHLLDRIRVKLR